jgi:hypothetical protein
MRLPPRRLVSVAGGSGIHNRYVEHIAALLAGDGDGAAVRARLDAMVDRILEQRLAP